MINKENKFVSVVVYMHNESVIITDFLKYVIPVIEMNFEQYEMIFVDDGCQDDTVDLIQAYVKQENIKVMVNIIHMSFYQGVESSMNAGRDIAIGDFIYEFDSVVTDFPSNLLMQVYDKLIEGNDIVAASPKGKIRMTSRFFYYFYNKVNKGMAKIGPEAFRIISRRAVNRIKSMDYYIPYRKAVYMNCGLKAAVIRFEGTDKRTKIWSKAGTAERTGLALSSFIYFTDIMSKISAFISFLFLAVSVGMGIYILLDFFGSYKPVEGWLSIMGFLAVSFFGVFLMLTIILKYLSVILNLIFKQQRYLISDIEKVVKN